MMRRRMSSRVLQLEGIKLFGRAILRDVLQFKNVVELSFLRTEAANEELV